MSLQTTPQTLTNGSRPLQTGVLALIPTEILLDIIDAIHYDHRPGVVKDTLDNLSQTCSRLHNLARPLFFRADNCKQFYWALTQAHVTMMDRCEHYDAAPVNKLWNQPMMQHKTCVDVLLSNVNEGWDRDRPSDAWSDRKRDSIFNALKWLLDRGADAEAYMCNEIDGAPVKPCGHMTTGLLRQLQIGTTKRGMEVIFNMIQMLSSHGYPNPTRKDSIRRWGSHSDEHWFNDTMMETYTTESPLDLALKSHVIPDVLELMLKEHASRGLKLRDAYQECPASLVKLSTLENSQTVIWNEVSCIDTLLGTLHADLNNDSTNWSESYFGEVADIFQAKLKLMINYEMIDASEEALLTSIQEALYSIAEDCRRTGCHGEEYFKRTWVKLCEAVRPFASDPNLVHPSIAHDSRQSTLNTPARIHRFVVNGQWNPWRQWLLRKDASHFYDLLSKYGKLNIVREGVWYSEEEYMWRILEPVVDSIGMTPRWHTTSLDEFCRFLSTEGNLLAISSPRYRHLLRFVKSSERKVRY